MTPSKPSSGAIEHPESSVLVQSAVRKTSKAVAIRGQRKRQGMLPRTALGILLLLGGGIPTVSPAVHVRSPTGCIPVCVLPLLLALLPSLPRGGPWALADTYIPDIYGKRRHISEADPYHEVRAPPPRRGSLTHTYTPHGAPVRRDPALGTASRREALGPPHAPRAQGLDRASGNSDAEAPRRLKARPYPASAASVLQPTRMPPPAARGARGQQGSARTRPARGGSGAARRRGAARRCRAQALSGRFLDRVDKARRLLAQVPSCVRCCARGLIGVCCTRVRCVRQGPLS
jgi:hypothetical protein